MSDKKERREEKKRARKAEKKERKKTGNNTLFDNPMVRNAMKNMTPEQIEQYKEMGEQFFKGIDFENSVVENNDPLTEPAYKVLMGVKSGLHPSYLEDNEKMILEQVYGEKWYEEYGFVEEDLASVN